MSDMAPNLSGMRVNDQARWRELAECAAGFAAGALRYDGAFLVKLFQGEETASYLQMLRERFASVAVRKPAASRARSSESYALARGLVPPGGSAGSLDPATGRIPARFPQDCADRTRARIANGGSRTWGEVDTGANDPKTARPGANRRSERGAGDEYAAVSWGIVSNGSRHVDVRAGTGDNRNGNSTRIQ